MQISSSQLQVGQDYLINDAPILYFLLKTDGTVLDVNTFTRNILGEAVVGSVFEELLVNFQKSFNIEDYAGTEKHHLLSISIPDAVPKSYYFLFRKIDDLIVVFGKDDADELDMLRSELFSSNQELNNLTRTLHKKNAQLAQKEKALTKSISDLKSAQAKLIESEKMASLGRLVAGFAHEINTPIGIALTASSSIEESSKYIDYMLKQDEVEENDLVSTLESIRDASKLVLSNLHRSADLVGSFKRTSIDQSYENVSEYCLNDAINDVLTSMQIKISNTPIQANFQGHEKINLHGNPGDIFQVISNLFENSVLHGFDAGKQEGEISIAVEREEKNILIHYADTGKGMSTEVVSRIFEPFYTTLRARGGTGLGMYICHNIVTSRLNGTIDCTSIQGGGAKFIITLPCMKDGSYET